MGAITFLLKWLRQECVCVCVFACTWKDTHPNTNRCCGGGGGIIGAILNLFAYFFSNLSAFNYQKQTKEDSRSDSSWWLYRESSIITISERETITAIKRSRQIRKLDVKEGRKWLLWREDAEAMMKVRLRSKRWSLWSKSFLR